MAKNITGGHYMKTKQILAMMAVLLGTTLLGGCATTPQVVEMQQPVRATTTGHRAQEHVDRRVFRRTGGCSGQGNS